MTSNQSNATGRTSSARLVIAVTGTMQNDSIANSPRQEQRSHSSVSVSLQTANGGLPPPPSVAVPGYSACNHSPPRPARISSRCQ